MNIDHYISLKAENIHKQLISDILLNAEGANELLDRLTETIRYKEDYVWRASVETAKVYLFIRRGNPSEVIKRGSGLVEIAALLQEWELLSFDYNMIGSAYFMLGMYEKAMEYYYSAINNEREHGLRNILPAAYGNIGRIFLNLGIYEKAVEHLRPALIYFADADKDYFRLGEKIVHILSDIMSSVTMLENPDVDEIQDILEQLEAIDGEKLSTEVAYVYYLGLMAYFFWIEDYIRAKEEFSKALARAKERRIYKIAVLYSFVEGCHVHGLDLDFFAEVLLEIEEMATDEEPISEPMIYDYLRHYYIKLGDTYKADKIQRNYKTFLENKFELNRQKKAESLEIFESLLKIGESLRFNVDKNKEFELVAKEAIRNKNELQRTYDRFKMIHEIGIKLTSSTNLNEVVNLIYKNMRENIPVDAFIIMSAEPENNQLRSLLCYNMGKENAEFTVSLDSKESAFVRCCMTNSIITSEDEGFTPHFDYETYSTDEIMRGTMKSALFIPLAVGDKVIGAYSVQSRYEKSYRPETIDFLRELKPYLVIALNNAVHAKKLETEIERNKEIQEKLREANSRLSKMAGIDALTQISNRREFTEKFYQLRIEADKADKPVSVFMFDIDDFKKFNDTYGHFEGDEALKKVAGVINNNIIKNDGIAARFGGEEFISACMGLSEEENLALGEKIRNEVLELGIKNIDTKLGTLSISVGIAISNPGRIVVKSEIMSLADEMLYEAKKSGKNKVVMKVVE